MLIVHMCATKIVCATKVVCVCVYATKMVSLWRAALTLLHGGMGAPPIVARRGTATPDVSCNLPA